MTIKHLILSAFLIAAWALSARCAEPNFWHVAPVRNVTASGNTTWDDVLSHCSPGKEDRQGDIGTHCHETVHSINSDMRNATGLECYYCLGGRAIVLHKTKQTKLSDVAARVPVQWHNYDYNVYLVNARQWWNDTPTYVLDEYAAYRAGSAARGYTQDDRNHLSEFAVFSDALVQAVTQIEPEYCDLRALRDAVEWMKH
jgi:hypothetical protein